MATALHIEPHARREMRVEDAQLRAKADAPGSGSVEGYAAVWGNVDHQSEVMVKGAFARSIQQVVPARKVKLMARHFAQGGDVLECIGTIVEAKEDDHGLFMQAEFASTALAQDVRTLILEKHAKGLSIGFMPLKWEVRNEELEDGKTKTIVAHTECRFAEVTVTVRPANELAEITGAKSVSGDQVTGKSGPGVLPATPQPLDLTQAHRDLHDAELYLFELNAEI